MSGLEEDWLESGSSALTSAQLYLRLAKPSIMKQLDMLREASTTKATFACKEVFLPVPELLHTDATVKKYMACGIRPEDMSYLDWLRGFRTDVEVPYPYAGKHAVSLAVFFASRAKDAYYGQWLVANVPFRQVPDLEPDGMLRVPGSHRLFAACVLLAPKFWRNAQAVENALLLEHSVAMTKQHLLMHSALLRFVDPYLHHGWRAPRDIQSHPAGETPLCKEQVHVLAWLEDAAAAMAEQLDVEKPVAYMRCIAGQAGTGKSAVLDAFIASRVAVGGRTLVTSPTGVLAETYRQRLWRQDAVNVDTFDGAFMPFQPAEVAAQKLASFDVWVIDEVFFLSQAHLEWLRVVHTLCDQRPLVVAAGDPSQLSAFQRRVTPTFLHKHGFSTRWLYTVHRTKDVKFLRLQRAFRGAFPSARDVQHAVGQRLVSASLHESVFKFVTVHPDGLMLAVSRRAVWDLNLLAIAALAEGVPQVPVLVEHHGEPRELPVFEGMTLMITSNLQKTVGLVNGALGKVLHVHRDLLVVQLENGNVLPVHKLRFGNCAAFPVHGGYAATIAKVQGRTLNTIGLWLDTAAPGAAYVAITRCRALRDVRWLVAPAVRDCPPPA